MNHRVDIANSKKIHDDFCLQIGDAIDLDDGKNPVKHKIVTGGRNPSDKLLPLAKRNEREIIIGDLKKEGVIDPSNSPCVPPVLLVKEMDGY